MQFVRAPRLVNVEHHEVIIIDTHGGIEDIVGIMSAIYLSRIYEKKIIGITCVAGKRNVDDAVTDALLAVKLCNANIPVYKGASKPIINKSPFPKTYYQSDNFQFIDSLKPKVLGLQYQKIIDSLIQEQSAAKFIAQSALKYKEQLAITTFGPLTNLAVAFHYEYKVKDVGTVSLLGGQYTGVGNVVGKYSAQANFHHDPQATHIIIHNFAHNVYITPIERVLEIDWKEKLRTVQKQSSIDDYNKSLLNQFDKHEFVFIGPLLAVFPLIIRNSLKKYYDVYSQICMDGNMIQGLLVINWFRLDVKEGEQVPNIKICCDFDVDRMLKQIIKSWCGVEPAELKNVTSSL